MSPIADDLVERQGAIRSAANGSLLLAGVGRCRSQHVEAIRELLYALDQRSHEPPVVDHQEPLIRLNDRLRKSSLYVLSDEAHLALPAITTVLGVLPFPGDTLEHANPI